METQLDLIKMSASQMFDDVFITHGDVEVIYHALYEMHELFITGKVYVRRI